MSIDKKRADWFTPKLDASDYNVTTLAGELGCEPSTVSRWKNDGVYPRNKSRRNKACELLAINALAWERGEDIKPEEANHLAELITKLQDEKDNLETKVNDLEKEKDELREEQKNQRSVLKEHDITLAIICGAVLLFTASMLSSNYPEMLENSIFMQIVFVEMVFIGLLVYCLGFISFIRKVVKSFVKNK